MATDPEALYAEVLQEEQQKGVTAAVAEGRAKAARARAEQGSPHPKEPKWWPGAQPHLEGGDGAAPAEEPAEEPAAEEAPAEEAPAAEAPAAEAPAEAPAAEAATEGAPESAPEPPSQPAAQPAAATAPQPAAAAAAPAPAPTATELPPDQRPSGVTHGTPGGNRLRPEDSVGTDAQFDGQQAMYRRRKMIDELVATGVPAVTAAEAARPRGTSLASILVYVVILALAAVFLVSQRDALSGGAPAEHAEEGGAAEGGGEGLTISASGTQFDTDQLTLPADGAELEFVNDDSLQHNVSILEEEGAADKLFAGDIIPGGQTITYSIPAIEPGEYYFQCDVHPSMNGTATVE